MGTRHLYWILTCPAFAVWEPDSLNMRVYAAFGWKWISSGHRFSPELSRLTLSFSSYPMVSAVSLAGCVHRLLFLLEPTKANQTLGRLNFSWLRRLSPNSLKRQAQEAAINFMGNAKTTYPCTSPRFSLDFTNKDHASRKLKINSSGTIFSTIWPILWIISGLVITRNIAPKKCNKFDCVFFLHHNYLNGYSNYKCMLYRSRPKKSLTNSFYRFSNEPTKHKATKSSITVPDQWSWRKCLNVAFSKKP